MRRTCTEVENNIIRQSLGNILPSVRTDNKKLSATLLKEKQFWINGGTFVECTWEQREGCVVIRFVEDDFRNNAGNVCCFQYPVCQYINLKPGDRLLIVHCANGAFFPMPLNQTTRHFIPEYPPAYFYKMNWNEVQVLPHPMGLYLEDRSTIMNEMDKAEMKEKCRRVKKLRPRDWVATLLVGFLLFLVFGFLFVWLIIQEILVEFTSGMICLAIFGVLCVVGTIAFAVLLIAMRVAPFKKLNYKKQVLFHSCIHNKIDENGLKRTFLYVYENINNCIYLVSYPVGFHTFPLNNACYGQILHKCSKNAVSCAKDKNYFY